MILKEKIKEIIDQALDMLYKNDIYLIKKDSSDSSNEHVGERAIMFKLAQHIQNTANEILESNGYVVDCEYNRNKYKPKKLQGKKVYPDIIIHKRGGEDNILVLELKTWWNKNTEDDIERIKLFTQDENFHYQYGASILITKDRNEVDEHWYHEGQEISFNQ